MAIYIKAVGCECDDCTPNDPCALGCECGVSILDTLDDAVTKDDDYDVTADFVFSANITIDVDFSADGSGMRFQVLADAVSIYDSGCQTSWADVDSVSVPAGTVTLTVEFTNCGGAVNSEGVFSITC
jgi:hypothetical protein